MLQTRDLVAGDIPVLKSFAPPEWNVDISRVFARHFGQPYFHPVVAEWNGATVGCANGLVQGRAGWLGNIIVLPEFRGRGIGSALTQCLMDFFEAKDLQFQILVATAMGEPVYRRLGFHVSSDYIFFTRQNGVQYEDNAPATRAVEAHDERAMVALDRLATGETRQAFLRRYIEQAWVHTGPTGALDGYYLPALGTGLLIASNDEAGLALLDHRLSQAGQVSVVPEQNQAAVDFLRANGFIETSRAPRMVLGPDIDWHPEHVYCRGSGFCG